MNINRLVLDLSHYETVNDYNAVKAAGIVGIIWKATQGTGFQDDAYWNNRAKATTVGLLWGSYHFGTSDDVGKQVNNYLQFAQPLPDELICLDLEPNPDSQMTQVQARAFVQGVETALDRVGECVLYSGNTIKEMLGNTVDTFWGARRLWLAQYGNLPVVQKSWDTYWLWQYTDGTYGPLPHTVPGISGGIDCSHFSGTPSMLEAQWATPGGIPGPVPVPPPEQIVKISIQAPPGIKVEVTQQ